MTARTKRKPDWPEEGPVEAKVEVKQFKGRWGFRYKEFLYLFPVGITEAEAHEIVKQGVELWKSRQN